MVEHGAFARAAELVYATPSAVSQQIQALEAEIGARLLERDTRNVRLTQSGEVLCRYAREILSLSEAARQEISSLKGDVTGELIVGASTIPGEHLLPGLLASFAAAHPAVKVGMRIGDSMGIITEVRQGRLGIGIVGARTPHKALTFDEFADDNLVAVVAPSHPWAGQADIRLEELARQPFILREQGSGTRLALEEHMTTVGIDPDHLDVRMELASTEAVKQAVMAGAGVSVLSFRAIAVEREAGLIHPLELRDQRIVRQFHVVFNREKNRSPLEERFLQFLDSAREGEDALPAEGKL